MKNKRSKKQSGFTLLELMVVVVILGILASVVAPNLLGSKDTASQKKATVDVKSLETALDTYRLNHNAYPTTDQGLEALVSEPSNPTPRNYPREGYIKRLPQDPWGYDYQYLSPSDSNGTVSIFTFGADGQEGGEGVNADIGNWNLEKFQ